MSLTAAQVIDGALVALGPDGEHWGQGHFEDEHGNMCLSGALKNAATRLPVQWRKALGATGPGYRRAWEEVVKIIHDEYRILGIPTWNDSLSDFGPVRAVLEKAKANLEGLT